MKQIKKYLLLLILLFYFSGCATVSNNQDQSESSNLTVGTVKKEIIKGKTTQAEIMQLFGSPNLVTKNSEGYEVWNYNRMSYTTKTGSDAGSVIFWGSSRAMSTATTKSFDLILTFDENDIVQNYSVISASY
ncbi:MAG TPA: hypothetical protein PKJ62_07345 [Bacteroidia bacterium]|nr:hypothetical protein [Bacteroidia bacterium]